MQPGEIAELFWSRVRRGADDECWPWLAARSKGYGYFHIKCEYIGQAHRWSYEHANGAIPDGLFIDHLCHTRDESCPGGATCPHRGCVNPGHMEPVSLAENVLRGRGLSAENARKVECKRGHPLSGDNLYQCGGKRACKACREATFRAFRAARKTMPHPRDRTHCPQGHAYAGENLIVERDGHRTCRACHRAKMRRQNAKRAARKRGLEDGQALR